MSAGKSSLWQAFKCSRRAYWSLRLFVLLFILSCFAEVLSNDRPLWAWVDGRHYFPVLISYSEQDFVGGEFATAADYFDPFFTDLFAQDNAVVIWPPNRFRFDTVDYESPKAHPASPDARHFLGTDDRGRDILARLLYGFRVSVWFGLALALVGTVLGIVAGALQGYFVGKVDLIFQRLIEIWSALPELYLLLLFSSFFQANLLILFVLLSLFGWMGLADYVRAEFLKNRQMDYVLAARALGLSHGQIIWRHILPNSLTPVITFFPFRISGAILALTSLDFLGLGVPSSTASLGELLAQGKENLDAWWISLPTFGLLTALLLLLIFVGEGLRAVLDVSRQPRK